MKLGRSIWLWQVTQSIREGKANPRDAKRLLRYFCYLVKKKLPIPPRLVQHLGDAFQAFLNGERTIQAALGLVRAKKGAPPKIETDRQRVLLIASDVLLRRLKGNFLEAATQEVAMLRHMSESRVREHWRKNKAAALDFLRSSQKRPWTQAEIKRLSVIYRRHIVRARNPEKGRVEPDIQKGRWLII